MLVQTADNSIHQINHYQVDSVLCFGIIYTLDSDLSRGERYLPFEQPGPEVIVMPVISNVIVRVRVILFLKGPLLRANPEIFERSVPSGILHLITKKTNNESSALVNLK